MESVTDLQAEGQGSNSLLEAALFLASNGSKILPLWWVIDGPNGTLICACSRGSSCTSPGKHPYGPAVPNGLDDAATDPELIRAWWARAPYANVGRVVREDETVLDVDGPAGEEKLRVITNGYQLPATVEVRTGRGRQLLFRKQPGVRALHKWCDQLQLKDWGYVVAAPSLHQAGRYYKVRRPGPKRRADVPSWLLNGQSPGRVVIPSVQGSNRDWSTELQRGFAAGSRNESLWHLAVYLAEQRVPRDAAEVVMRGAVLQQQPGGGSPPVTWAQAVGMLERAYASRPEQVLPAAPPKEWRAWELDEFLNQPAPEYDFIIPGVLERGDRLILTGYEGAGKTTCLRQVGVQSASGIHPFTLELMDPLKVLMLEFENSEMQSRRALRELREIAGDRYAVGNFHIEVELAGLDLRSNRDEDARWLDARVGRYRPDLLIVGPTYKMTSGDWEQSAQSIQSVLDALRSEYGCALLLEAHTPHGTTNKDGGERRPKRPIGSAAWLRWPEFGVHLAADGALTHWRGARDDQRAWPLKLKRGGEWPWTVTDPLRNEDGKLVMPAAKLTRPALHDWLRDKGSSGATAKDVAAAAQVTEVSARNWLKKLVEEDKAAPSEAPGTAGGGRESARYVAL